MTGVIHRIGLAPMLGATLIFGGPPASAAAIDDRILVGADVHGSLSVDLDGDGSREVVVLHAREDRGPVQLTIWSEGGSGWERIAREDVSRLDDAGRLVPAISRRDAVGMLVVDDAAGERIVLAASGEDGVGSCCMTLIEVTMRQGRVQLSVAPEPHAIGEGLQAVDLDGDGVDELVTFSSVRGAEPDVTGIHYRLLRRIGPAEFVSETIAWPAEAQPARISFVGETDGITGEEVVVAPERGTGLYRLHARSDGSLGIDATDGGDLVSPPAGWIAASADGRLVVRRASEVAVATWPRGGSLRDEAAVAVADSAQVAVLGSGPEARLIVSDIPAVFELAEAPGASIYDLDLEIERSLQATPVIRHLHELSEREPALATTILERFFPYTGPLHGGMPDGSAAQVVAGQLFLRGGTGATEAIEISELAGTIPLGVAGTNGRWMLLGRVWFTARDAVPLFPFNPEEFTAILVPTDDVLSPDHRGAFEVDFGSAASRARGDGSRVAFAPGEAQARVAGPEGSALTGFRNSIAFVRELLGSAPLELDLAPPRRSDGNEAFEVAFVLVAPSGHVEVATWDAAILREAPELDVGAEVRFLATRAAVVGRTAPGTDVTVDGSAVEVGDTGRFTTEVEAPPWPRDIVVVARDPVGHESVERLQVVGIVDYRGVPWPLLLALVTVGIGAVLFVRTPRRPIAVDSASPSDEGQLEEIDAD